MVGGLEGHPWEDDISDGNDDSRGQVAPPPMPGFKMIILD
jgi:hypothetical protein